MENTNKGKKLQSEDMISFTTLKDKLNSHFAELNPSTLETSKKEKSVSQTSNMQHGLNPPVWNGIGRREDRIASSAYKGDIKEVECCLQLGVPVDSKQQDGSTSLSYAAWQGHVDIVDLLLLHGASIGMFFISLFYIDLPDENGFTAVHYAVVGGNLEIFNLLMGYSLDDKLVLRRVVNTGDTVLHLGMYFFNSI
jgi:hypothetical protein